MVEAPGAEAAPGRDEPRWDARATLRVLLLWLIAANIRTVILALPPVLPDIHRELQLNELQIGVLTTLPVLLLGAAAVAGSAAVTHLGVRRTLVAGCVAVGAASALRGAGGVAALFGGSVLLGLAVSVLQPALPTVAQAWFGARVGVATAIYGNGFVAGEAIAASITLPFVVPLAGGWRPALVLWGAPCVLVAAMLLLPVASVRPASPAGAAGWLPDLRDGWTWRLGAFQAGGSVLYFGTNAYIPTQLHAVGHGDLVGACLAALNITQLGAAPLVGVLAHLGARTRPVMAACGAGAAGGLALVAFLPGPAAVVGCAIVGLTSAAGFAVALALPAIVAPPSEVHRLSAGMFSIGYLAAFVLPLTGGLAWDSTGEPRTAFLPGLAGAALLAFSLAGGRTGRAGSDPVARLARVEQAAEVALERA